MKRLFFLQIFVFLTISLWGGTYGPSDIEQPRKYNAANWVSNPDNILSQAAVEQMNLLLNDINARSGAQVAVAVIDNYKDTDIDDFATNLFHQWGVGEKGANNGVLLVVAVDAREYAFRTGRGIGAALPDVTTARIARSSLIPNLKAGDIDQALVATVGDIHDRLTTTEAINEIREASERAKEDDDPTVWDIIFYYLWWCVALTVFLAILFIVKAKSTSTLDRHLRYKKLRPTLRIIYGLGFVGLGIPFLVYFPAKQFLHNLRDGEHKCPNCGEAMHKLDEVQDNEKLTPAQDAEERFDSVDYDVWVCPNCGEEDIYAFENTDSPLQECPHCHARTAAYVRDRIVKTPTPTSEGVMVKEFSCLNCHRPSEKREILPRVAKTAATPFIFPGRGGGFGGGSFGGGFGGGFTGGGGTSGRW